MSVQTEAIIMIVVFAIVCFAITYFIPNEED
jgi:hypothetical protein